MSVCDKASRVSHLPAEDLAPSVGGIAKGLNGDLELMPVRHLIVFYVHIDH